MKEKQFMGSWEIGCLVLNLMLYRVVTRMPRIFMANSGTGAPVSALISGVVAIILIIGLCLLYRRLGTHNIISAMEELFGKTGKLVSIILLIVYMVISAVFSLREFSQLAQIIALPFAPLWFAAIFFIIAAAIASFRGINSIIRTHVVVVPIMVLLTIAVLVSASVYIRANNLFPIFGNGAKSVIGGGLKGLLMYSDIIIVFLINPFDRDDGAEGEKSIIIPACLGVLLSAVTVFIFNAITAYPVSGEVEFPIYHLLKMVYYGRFFQRIDAVYMFVAALSGMLYLSTVIFLLSRTLSDLGKEYKAFNIWTVTLSILVFVLALSYKIMPDLWLKNILDTSAIGAGLVTLIGAVFYCGAKTKKKKHNKE